MSDSKKYYYMRLKENFFDSDNMILLESMPDGYLYSNILLKLYLRSLKDDGRLMLNKRIPYNPQMIATVVRHQIGTVEKALNIFIELGLIEVLDNGAIYMLDIQNYIGQSSTEADRQRAYYNKMQAEKKALQSGEESCKKSNMISTPEIEKEIDIEIDIEIEKETESSTNRQRIVNESSKKEKTVRHKHGTYNNVLLSDIDFEKLKNEFPYDWQQRIERLSEYMASTGKSYKNHLATIRSWSRKDKQQQPKTQQRQVFHDKPVIPETEVKRLSEEEAAIAKQKLMDNLATMRAQRGVNA